jgi:hypothetical protein
MVVALLRALYVGVCYSDCKSGALDVAEDTSYCVCVHHMCVSHMLYYIVLCWPDTMLCVDLLE